MNIYYQTQVALEVLQCLLSDAGGLKSIHPRAGRALHKLINRVRQSPMGGGNLNIYYRIPEYLLSNT